mgnify:CR=1 FL=1
MATRNLVINDPVGIHARPAAQFAQAVTASNCNVTIAKEGGDAVPAGSILSIMGWASSRATPWSSTSKAPTPMRAPTS